MSDGGLIVGSTFLAGIEAHPLGQMQCPVWFRRVAVVMTRQPHHTLETVDHTSWHCATCLTNSQRGGR